MLDAGLAAAEAVWMGMNILPLSLPMRLGLLEQLPVLTSWISCVVSPSASHWGYMGPWQQLKGTYIHKCLKNYGLLWIYYFPVFEKETIPKGNALLLLLFTVGIILLSRTDECRGRFLWWQLSLSWSHPCLGWVMTLFDTVRWTPAGAFCCHWVLPVKCPITRQH